MFKFLFTEKMTITDKIVGVVGFLFPAIGGIVVMMLMLFC